MRPTTAPAGLRPDHNLIDINALLHPERVFNHPRDVVRSRDLTLGEKRAILASWASDAATVASCPGLLAPAGLSAPVRCAGASSASTHERSRSVARFLMIGS